MTTDRSKRLVRTAAIAGTALAGAGVAVAVGANPFPVSQHPQDSDVLALEKRERALSKEATRVNAINAERWADYRQDLAQRQKVISQVEAANARALAAQGSASSGSGYSSGGSSYSAPQATYVPPAAPVASSGSS